MSSRILRRAGVLALLATLALSGLAFARAGDRSFQQTYPIASRLCARAAANTLPKRLELSVAKVDAACTRLQGAFGPLQSTVLAAQSTFANGVSTTRAGIRLACAKGQPRPACRTARRQGRARLRALRIQHRAAIRTYGIAIEANRRTFWATIRSLRGGRSIRPDAPIAIPTS